jgi:hypothetical protein
MALERQLWWGFETINPERHLPEDETVRYYFVIINDKRESMQIENRIFRVGRPIDTPQIKRGKFGKMNYTLISFLTQNFRIEGDWIREIYSGRVVEDKRLYERESDDKKTPIEKLEDYVLGKLGRQV